MKTLWIPIVSIAYYFYLPHILKSNTRGGTMSVARGNTVPVAPVTVYDAVGRVTAHVLSYALDDDVAGQQRGHEFYYREMYTKQSKYSEEYGVSYDEN